MMHDQGHDACAKRLRTALDLADSGIQMRALQLQREYPDESEAAIRQRLNEWLKSSSDGDHQGEYWRRVDPSSYTHPDK